MKKTISGIRGIFGKDLTLIDVITFCNNFSSLVKSKKCIVANDTRPSSKIIQQTVTASLMQNGIDVYDLGLAPTPVTFREAREYGAGVMITSSHNPLEWNGLKFIIDGRGINERELNIILNKQKSSNANIGVENKIESDYIEKAAKLIGKISDPPKVVMDIGGGAASKVAPKLLERLGCKITIINDSIENCSRGTDPTVDKLSELVKYSKDHDIGFAFDLDGDRLVVVKDGVKLYPDVTLGLGVAKALDLGHKKFVFSIDTSIAIEKFVKENGGTVLRSKVGESNVIGLMLETNSSVGGEGSSGGFILSDFNYCRDGIVSSGLIASMLGSSKFDYLLSFMEKYHQLRDRIEVKSEKQDEVITNLREKMQNLCREISTLDGIKGIIDDNSWVLIRKSNTEDIIRISVESDNLEKTGNYLKQLKDLAKQNYDQIR